MYQNWMWLKYDIISIVNEWVVAILREMSNFQLYYSENKLYLMIMPALYYTFSWIFIQLVYIIQIQKHTVFVLTL